MLSSGQILVCFVLLSICFSLVRSKKSLTKFSIVLNTPNKRVEPTEIPHKSVHVKYILQNGDEQWNIVGFEPQIQVHQKAIEQLTVHLCDSVTQSSIWYDDSSVCGNARSMLIYQWTPYSSVSPFRFSDDAGFAFNKSQSIILTVVYHKEKRAHKEQTGIILYISTNPMRFQMGTILAGNEQRGTHFSCRSSTFPRLLYAVKKLTSEKNEAWWRIHIIRIRQFGRKIVQSVLDSEHLTDRNHSHIEMTFSDLFLMSGDYLFIECANLHCYFLLYFLLKSKEVDEERTCQDNNYPDLFKLIPSKTIAQPIKTSNIDGLTIFLTFGVLLFIVWISIIIGCIILRRVRGLVNFRTSEPLSPLDGQKNRLLSYRGRSTHDNYNQRTGDADHIIQIDGEQGGQMF